MKNSISSYMKDVSRHKLLTREEEVSLSQRIEKGDRLARDMMIQSNLRLAISIAKKYSNKGCSLEDLIQESNIGLMKAIEKFDWRKGYKFSTYGSWWIKQAATRHLTNNNSILKVPAHTIALSRKILKITHEYKEEFNEDITPDELANILNVSIKHVNQSLSAIKARHSMSIDKPIGSDDSTRKLADILPDPAKNPEEVLFSNFYKEEIIKAFKCLTKREELILRMRFGIHETTKEDPNITITQGVK